MSQNSFLPISHNDMHKRGWDELDIIIITGDAYVDHHSFGAALIGRVLEADGYKVGIIAQPNWHNTEDFKKLGRPRLFFGITSGNVDSMVSHYTANRHRRKNDDYSPSGIPNRPDRALIVYANRVREAFGNIPIVLGGIEASMRRFAHYDWWSNSVRRSIILDARGDILVYGMGENPVREIARRLNDGEHVSSVDGIRGTVVIRKKYKDIENNLKIPSFEAVKSDKKIFNEAFRLLYKEQSPLGKTLIQQHGDRYVIQFAAQFPMKQTELDRVYELPFMRAWHSVYEANGGVPAFETVRFSMVSHRGCPGGCSFCGISIHQGKIVQSRSEESLIREAKHIASDPLFKGTITDVGGPTANLYRAHCKQWEKGMCCSTKECLVPDLCENLKLEYKKSIDLYSHIKAIAGVKNVFIGSGVRYDLCVGKSGEEYLEKLCVNHVSGQLKVAPEHASKHVLQLMNKPSFLLYEKFSEKFYAIQKKIGKKQFLVHYFICGHPGTFLKDALHLAVKLTQKRIHPEQIQDFMPLPMTVSGCMYYTRMHPLTNGKVHIPDEKERGLERALIQYWNPKNKPKVLKALTILKSLHLCRLFRVSPMGNSDKKHFRR